METYLQLGSNSVVRLHSLLIASRLNRISRHDTTDNDDNDDDDDGGGGGDGGDGGELRPLIRSSLLSALSTLPLRDVVSMLTATKVVVFLHFMLYCVYYSYCYDCFVIVIVVCQVYEPDTACLQIAEFEPFLISVIVSCGIIIRRRGGRRRRTTTTNILWPLHRLTCASQHPRLRTGRFCWSKILLLLTAASVFELGRRRWSFSDSVTLCSCHEYNDSYVIIIIIQTFEYTLDQRRWHSLDGGTDMMRSHWGWRYHTYCVSCCVISCPVVLMACVCVYVCVCVFVCLCRCASAKCNKLCQLSLP